MPIQAMEEAKQATQGSGKRRERKLQYNKSSHDPLLKHTKAQCRPKDELHKGMDVPHL